MKDEKSDKIYAVLWTTFIHFNLKTRKSEPTSDEIITANQKFLINIEQYDFQSRVNFLRLQNK